MDKTIVPTGDVLEIFAVKGSFGECITELSGVKPSVDVFSPYDLGVVRRLTGKDSKFSKNGCWTNMTFNYKDDEIVIAPRVIDVGFYHPIFTNAVKATRDQYGGKEFFLDDKVWNALRERAVKDPEKALRNGSPLLLSRSDRKAKYDELPVVHLQYEPDTVYLFGDEAKVGDSQSSYANFLLENKVVSVPRYIVDNDFAVTQGKPFARVLWIGAINYRSNLVGEDCLYTSGRVFGGRRAKILQWKQM